LPLVGVLTIGIGTPLGILIGQNAPVPGAPVLVLAAPWTSADRVAASASAYVILPGRVPFVGLVYSQVPDFQEYLRQSGAWLVLDGRLSRAFCVTI